ncbi:hypothetical protein AB190_00095 (plasmid) [Enterobacter asburiae]|jgi:hypothetical protein|nr:hypothetical protein AB190_00095 [Enterobacter asburiae]KUH31763.1 hypothetical protein ARC98_02530 [Escherichia coli]
MALQGRGWERQNLSKQQPAAPGDGAICRSTPFNFSWRLHAADAALWGSTPEPPKFLLPQLQPRNQCIQVNNFIAALEGIMSVKQNMLPGHR